MVGMPYRVVLSTLSYPREWWTDQSAAFLIVFFNPVSIFFIKNLDGKDEQSFRIRVRVVPGTGGISNCDMIETKPIRILIADDHWILRQSLRAILETRPGFEVVGEAGNGKVAIEKVQEVCPDVVLMDDRMPVLGGIEATRRIKKMNQKIIVIGLSNQSDKRYIQQMIDAGANDYLFKSASPSEIEASIRNAFSKSG